MSMKNRTCVRLGAVGKGGKGKGKKLSELGK